MLRPVATRASSCCSCSRARSRDAARAAPPTRSGSATTLSGVPARDRRRATTRRSATRILAPQLIETVEQIGLPCEVALEKGFEGVEEPRISVGTSRVDGDTATAEVRSSAAGQAPSEDTVELVRVGDGWRIASLGGTGAG